MILTDGIEIFGEGADEATAIVDAIAHCDLQGDDMEPVTAEWIARQLAIGEASDPKYSHGLHFDEADDAQ